MESPMIAPSEPTTITVHRASRPSLASTPPKKTTTSPGKMNPANTDASAAGSRKIKTSASHGGKPSTCSMSQLTIDTTKALRRLNPSNDGVPAVGASPGAARNAGPGAAALGRHGAGRARADRADRRGRDDGHRAGGQLGDGSVSRTPPPPPTSTSTSTAARTGGQYRRAAEAGWAF